VSLSSVIAMEKLYFSKTSRDLGMSFAAVMHFVEELSIGMLFTSTEESLSFAIIIKLEMRYGAEYIVPV
jgi:hypothetical protein